MGVYINNEVINEKKKKEHDKMVNANMMLQIAEKEAKIQKLQGQNSAIMLEIALIKGGI